MRWFRPARTRRLGLVAGLGALLSGLMVVVAPVAANAGAIVPCPDGITEWKLIQGRYPSAPAAPAKDGTQGIVIPIQIWEGYRYTLVSADRQFLVSDGQALDNGSDQPATYEISSSRTRTYKVAATVGITANKVEEFLNLNVSTTIESTISTTLGVKFTTTVPPRTRLIAEYGTDVYQVSYYIEAWRYKKVGFGTPPPTAGTPGCEEWGYYPQSTQAPTNLQTWRLRVG
jgi:hypothetical protein